MGILTDKGEILDLEPFPAILLFFFLSQMLALEYMSPGSISS